MRNLSGGLQDERPSKMERHFSIYGRNLRLHTKDYFPFQTKFGTRWVCWHQMGHRSLGGQIRYVELRSISDPAEPDVKIKIYYSRRGDNLRMGEAQLDNIEYVFWRGKFAEVRIQATGPENFDHLKKFLFEKYGTVNKFQGAYSWDGSVTQISLRYDNPGKTSLLIIASTKIASQEVKDIFDKDKD